ncbi:MAG: CPBP family intramembrane glutamic endopeptidase [Bacteroidales bacterium]|nr:CPBP family intramembrane glutamic endopeptidase [Bacteroidales bacterium]
MKKIFFYFVDFHRTYFRLKLYAGIFIFIGLLIAFNYMLDFEDLYIDSLPKPIRLFGFLLYHGLAYYGVLFIIWLWGNEKPKFTRGFWLKSLLGLLILSFDRSYFTSLFIIIQENVPAATGRFYSKLSVNSIAIFSVFFPLLIIKQIFDRRKHKGLYGLTFQNVDWTPYLVMLLVMIPVVYAASFVPDFMNYYPTYKRTGGLDFANYYHISECWAMMIYETFYIGDFLFTELFFRGFLVIGLAAMLGRNAILPMAATYAVLHFGKPLGESISSVFGGYLLGIVALYSRNIWGGVFVHAGVAGLMELFAFWRMN